MWGEKDPGGMMKLINERLTRQADKHFARFGLTMAQFDLLGQLWLAPDHKLSFKELEKLLQIAQSSTFCTVARLERKGFVRKLDDPTDKRVKFVQLTQRGIAVCSKFFSDKETQQRIKNLGLDEEEVAQLTVLLEKIMKHIESIHEE